MLERMICRCRAVSAVVVVAVGVRKNLRCLAARQIDRAADALNLFWELLCSKAIAESQQMSHSIVSMIFFFLCPSVVNSVSIGISQKPKKKPISTFSPASNIFTAFLG
ncbi:hypothetical protein Tco_0252101 [Tanacetum coccineum]